MMLSYSTPERNRALRLNITSVCGYFNLFFQFNYPKYDKKINKPAYDTLTLLMANALRQMYKEEGLKKYNDENFYRVTYTDNLDGFCLNVQWEHSDTEQQALDITHQTLEYVLTFNPEEHNYAKDEIKKLVKEGIEGAKKIAEQFRKDIFDNHSIDFQKEYWSPFD